MHHRCFGGGRPFRAALAILAASLLLTACVLPLNQGLRGAAERVRAALATLPGIASVEADAVLPNESIALQITVRLTTDGDRTLHELLPVMVAVYDALRDERVAPNDIGALAVTAPNGTRLELRGPCDRDWTDSFEPVASAVDAQRGSGWCTGHSGHALPNNPTVTARLSFTSPVEMLDAARAELPKLPTELTGRTPTRLNFTNPALDAATLSLTPRVTVDAPPTAGTDETLAALRDALAAPGAPAASVVSISVRAHDASIALLVNEATPGIAERILALVPPTVATASVYVHVPDGGTTDVVETASR